MQYIIIVHLYEPVSLYFQVFGEGNHELQFHYNLDHRNASDVDTALFPNSSQMPIARELRISEIRRTEPTNRSPIRRRDRIERPALPRRHGRHRQGTEAPAWPRDHIIRSERPSCLGG